jgi:hypothetical protein
MSVIRECGAAGEAGKRRGNRSTLIKLATVPVRISSLYSSHFFISVFRYTIYIFFIIAFLQSTQDT